MSIVGKDIKHNNSAGHVSGKSLFIDDYPLRQDELFVDFVGAPTAKGILKTIKFDECKKIEGFVQGFTAKDIDGAKNWGPIFHDEVFLVEKEYEYLMQPVAVVCATSREALRLAKTKVIIEYDELKPILSIDEAIRKKSFIDKEKKIECGNMTKGFNQANKLLEGTFIMGGQEQFYLESQAAICYPLEYNMLEVHSSSQHPTEVQSIVAEVMGLKFNQVISICERMGGAFGGKESQAALPALAAALVAHKLKRPARVIYTKDDDMQMTGKRHPYKVNYKVGFSNDGVINALEIMFYSNGGATADLSTSILERTILHVDNSYFLENARIRAIICKTNLPSNTAFRGFGGPQGIVAIENIIEEIAAHLNRDPYAIRMVNLYQHEKNNVTPYGQIVENHVLPEVMQGVRKTSRYDQRLKKIKQFNKNSKTHLKGISLIPIKFGISFTTKFLNQGNALVNIYTDGTIQVSQGGTEMGQGLYTKIQQIVADEFSINHQFVRVMKTSTEKNCNTSPTAASSGTDLNGMAAVDACQKIKKRLAQFAATHLVDEANGILPSVESIIFKNNEIFDNRNPQKKISFASLVKAAYLNRINMGERGFYATPTIDFNKVTGKGKPFFYFTSGAAVVEVLIDKLTGELKVEAIDILMDYGKSINPGIDKGQTTGGFVQGMGWVTGEELKYDSKGFLQSHSPTTYKIPNIQDIPQHFNVDFIKNDKHQINVRSSKAVGEPPLMLGIAVFTAVKHALSSVTKNQVVALKLPATNEEIALSLSNLQSGNKQTIIKTANPKR